MQRAGIRAAATVVVALAVAALLPHVAQAARQAPQVTARCPAGVLDGGYCGDGGPVEAARLAAPRDVAPLADGFLIADGDNSAIRRVDDRGVISTAAGIGILGSAAPRRGRPASIARFAFADPRGITAVPGVGYAVADAGLRAVLLVGDDGLVRTLLDRRRLLLPTDVVARDADTLVVADARAGRVLELDSDGATRTIASGLDSPWQVAPDPVSGGIYVSQQRADERGDVILVRPDGTRAVVAGRGAPGLAGRLRFDRVAGIVAEGAVVVVADRTLVRAVFPNGSVRVLAGVRRPGADPVNGVTLAEADGLAISPAGRLLIADSGRDQVATVPDVPASLAAPQPPETDEPVVDAVGRRSYPRQSGLPLTGPPAPRPRSACSQGTLARAFKALQAKRGQVLVRFTGRGALQVSLVQGTREREIYRKSFSRVDPRRPLLRVRSRRIRGSFYVRVRAPGGCRESDVKFRV